jgi:hypothetical protein
MHDGMQGPTSGPCSHCASVISRGKSLVFVCCGKSVSGNAGKFAPMGWSFRHLLRRRDASSSCVHGEHKCGKPAAAEVRIKRVASRFGFECRPIFYSSQSARAATERASSSIARRLPSGQPARAAAPKQPDDHERARRPATLSYPSSYGPQLRPRVDPY